MVGLSRESFEKDKVEESSLSHFKASKDDEATFAEPSTKKVITIMPNMSGGTHRKDVTAKNTLT